MTTQDWNELSKKVHALYLLSDVQESLILSIEKDLKGKGELKFDVKHYVNTIKCSTRLMVQHVNRHASVHNDTFANDAEKLNDIITKEFLK